MAFTSSKRIIATLAAAAVLTGVVGTAPAVAAPQPPVPQPYIDAFFPKNPQPAPSQPFDWKQRALDYDAFVYNWSAPGAHPTIYTDTTHYNMSSNTYKMPSYYGDTRINASSSTDGNQEGINQIASVVGASLVGVDKAAQGGRNYVDMLQTFYHPDLGVAENGSAPDPSGANGAGSWWYTGANNALYFMLAAQYPSAANMPTIQRSIADKFYGAVVALGGANANFNGQGFNFATMALYPGGRNEGGDGAAATAAILMWAYAKYGDPRYLQGAKWTMDFLERSDGSLYYEVMPLLAPYVASRMNALYGTHYDIGRALSTVMDRSSVRYSWGAMRDSWGGYNAQGLQGQLIDNYGPGSQGYAFAMNSFAGAFFAPTVKYDPQYANEIGLYLLNLSNAARFFYADQLPATNQGDGSRWINAPEKAIAYEGLRQEFNGTSPMATSDVTRFGYGGGDSDLGLYGASWVGLLGATVANTNVANIRRIDLNALDFYGDNTYPTYLYYNPGATAAAVSVPLSSTSDVYDAVTDTRLAQAVTGTASVMVPAGGSRVLTLIPANSTLVHAGGRTLVNGKVVGYQSGRADLAHDRPVTASSSVNGNLPSYLTDGYPNRRWESATSDPQWVTVDLGSSVTVSRVVMDWEAASAKSFDVQLSSDNSAWTSVYSTSRGTGGVESVTFPATHARYVKISMTQRNTQYAYSMLDLHVYDDDLAASKPTSASSVQNGNAASYVTDGDPSTRWESQTSDPQSLTVDLQTPQTVDQVLIDWEQAAAKNFDVSTSLDGATWSTAYSTTAGPGGQQSISFSPVQARYVRVSMSQRYYSQWAYSIWGLHIYHDDLAAFAPVNVSSTTNGNLGSFLVDRDSGTRWESQTSDPQSATVDLVNPSTVKRIVVNWETASAKSYSIQTSTDGTTWSAPYATTSGPGGREVIVLPGAGVTARFVRLVMTQRNTQWAYSIWDLEVYGQ